jgi:DNA-directed RNA polymerase specialized sigma24 family protein
MGKKENTSRGPAACWEILVARSALPDMAQADLDPGTSAATPSFSTAVHASLQLLPPQQRTVLQADLAARGRASVRDLARHLGTSPNSIYVSRSNGRRALYAALAERGHALGADGGEAASA